ncbi:MAG: hypothetical protein ACK2T0_05495 [Anaerolineales bacterium]
MSTSFPVYLEIGAKRTFAAAIEWPGWCRSGPDAAVALAALVDYGARYQHAIRSARLGFSPPKSVDDLKVVEKLKGSATTDFGSPAASPRADNQKLVGERLGQYGKLLKACWGTFDEAVKDARGRQLRRGPRGGGRDLNKIVEHVVGAEEAYLSRLGWSFKPPAGADPVGEMSDLRRAILEGLAASAAGKIPKKGPRGGARWLPRYYVRRAAWHMLDHAWEIQDRLP